MSVKHVPSPVGGWNAKDSLANMKPQEAVFLDNFFPGEGSVKLREGYEQHATGLGGNVEMLGEYHSGTTRTLIAAANGNLWDATSAGAASSLASGFGSNQWQYANMDGKMGLVNGNDAPQVYDGSTMSAMTVSGSGLTVTDLNNIYVFKSRSFFTEKNSQDFWYSATDALGGSLTKFPLSRVGNFGGKLISIGSFSTDAGDGPDDFTVFVMSSGEVIMYSGTDPAAASTWALVGVYKMGEPLSGRGFVKVGGDLIVMTRDGYIPMSTVFKENRFSNKNAISDKIRGAVQAATKSYFSNFGWQAIHYPKGNRVIFNVPVINNQTYHQHVYNTITGAWCRFKDINARAWGMYNDDIYFGGNGIVYKAFNVTADDDANIEGDALPAFSMMGSPNIKAFTGIQLYLSSDGTLPVGLSLGTDFRTPSKKVNENIVTSGTSAWGSPWDDTPWAKSITTKEPLYGVSGIGRNASCRINIKTKDQDVDWYSTAYIYENGGII